MRKFVHDVLMAQCDMEICSLQNLEINSQVQNLIIILVKYVLSDRS